MGTGDMYRIIFSTSYEPYTITCQCSNFRFSCGYYRISYLFFCSQRLAAIISTSLYISSLVLILRIEIP